MKEIVLGVWLGIQMIFDLKKKEIPLGVSLLGGGAGIIFCIMERREMISVLVACLPGVLAMGFSWISKEKMGYGDGLVLIVVGMYLPIAQLLSIGLQAFMIAGVVALIMLVVFHKKGTYRLPFIPFLGIAYGCDFIMRLEGV